jgi:hypothetical protein
VIDVAELMDDPDFCQPFQVRRPSGSFDEGEWIQGPPEVINMVGIIQPAKADDVLKLAPEGTRPSNWISVYCGQELRIDDTDTKRSDLILWRGAVYRVMARKPWVDFGFWQVIAEGIAA